MKISCDFHWEMGHRLPAHPSGCKNVHGHSYTMRVVIEGDVQPNGMVMDFYDLKKIVEPVVGQLDHAFLCTESDALMKDFLANAKLKCVVVPFPSTVENIATYFLDMIRAGLQHIPHIHRISVRVNETPVVICRGGKVRPPLPPGEGTGVRAINDATKTPRHCAPLRRDGFLRYHCNRGARI